MWWDYDAWSWSSWAAAAGAAMVLGERLVSWVVVVFVLGQSAHEVVHYASDPEVIAGSSFVAWYGLYLLALNTLATLGLYASVRLVGVVAELDRTRDALAPSSSRSSSRRASST